MNGSVFLKFTKNLQKVYSLFTESLQSLQKINSLFIKFTIRK